MGRIHSLRELLSHPDYVRLLGAQFLGQSADGIAQAAFAVVLVLDPLGARTPGRIFALFALTLLPYSLISPFMGVIVDRHSRRDLMMWTNALRALVMLTLPLWRGVVPGDAGLYASALVLLGLGRLFLTVKGALLPAVLGERNLLPGNAVSSGGGMICALVGGIVGIALSGVSSSVAFVVAGIGYALTSGVAALIDTGSAHRHYAEGLAKAATRVAAELRSGINEIAHRNRAWIPLAAIFVLRTTGMIVAIAAILVIKTEFPGVTDSGDRLGTSVLALGVMGAGAFAGTLVAPALGRRIHRGGLILCGFVISGVAIVSLGGIVDIGAVLTLVFVGGFGALLVKVSVDASVQDALPDELRGRAFALYDILYNCASVVAGGLMVATIGLGLRTALMASGLITLLLTLPLLPALRAAGMFSADDAGVASLGPGPTQAST